MIYLMYFYMYVLLGNNELRLNFLFYFIFLTSAAFYFPTYIIYTMHTPYHLLLGRFSHSHNKKSSIKRDQIYLSSFLVGIGKRVLLRRLRRREG